MKLDNETLLGSFLAGLHARIRHLAKLDFEKHNHPDYVGDRTPSPERLEMREEWEKLTKQVWELLELRLKPFHQLVEKGPYHLHTNENTEGPRCLRWNFGKLKKMADKHRRKHPEFMMLKSWDFEAKKRAPREDYIHG